MWSGGMRLTSSGCSTSSSFAYYAFFSSSWESGWVHDSWPVLVFQICQQQESKISMLCNLAIQYIRQQSRQHNNFRMIPRLRNHTSPEYVRIPSSPKANNCYGLYPNQVERQVLIDQIINNCQKVELPIGHSPRNSYQFSKNNSLRNEDKENIIFASPHRTPKLSLTKRQSFQFQKIHTHRPSSETEREKKNSISNNFAINEVGKAPNQYYPTIPKPPSPTFKVRANLDMPKTITAPIYTSQQPLTKQRQSIHAKGNEQNRAVMLRKLEDERVKHLQQCKREERKLRLYYVQLENKLCEMRNSELKQLAEYESSRLKQYDTCIRSLRSAEKPEIVNECENKLQQMRKQITKVNQSIKPEIRGCLFTGVSGVYFSFSQNIPDTAGI